MRDRCDLRVAAVSHIPGPFGERLEDPTNPPASSVAYRPASRPRPPPPKLLPSGRTTSGGNTRMRKRVIRAGEIEIEDSEGRVRARFGVTNEDLPFVSF